MRYHVGGRRQSDRLEGVLEGRRRLVLVLVTVFALFGIAFIVTRPTSGGASTLTSMDGLTTLTTQGNVASDTPYDSAQPITVTVAANSTLDAAALTGAGLSNGKYVLEECADPGATTANLPTTASDCESLTNTAGSDPLWTSSGALSTTFNVFALPDPNLGAGTLQGTCDDGNNPCVVGIFASNPQSTGVGKGNPHLYSAPFYVSAIDQSDGDDNSSPGDGSQLAVTGVSASESTVDAAPTTVTANGVDASQITVTLNDTSGVPITTGDQVSLTSSSTNSVIEVGGTVGSTGTTDGNGQIVFTVTDKTAESVTYTATDTSDKVQLNTQPSVTFEAPAVTATNSTITASPTTVAAANGTDSSSIMVTLNDQGAGGMPQPVANVPVTLSQGTGHSDILPATAVMTNAQGEATFTATDTTTETVSYSAAYGTSLTPLTGKSASVTFGNLTVSPTASTVTTTTPIVSSVAAANGHLSSGSVTVTLLQSDGKSAIAGKLVTLSSSSTTAQVVENSLTTGADGTATFLVNDPTAETVTFSAEDTTDTISLTSTVQIQFEPPAASAVMSQVTASTTSAPADGVTPVSISVTINDQFGNPLANKTVTIAGDVTGTSTPSQDIRIPASLSSGGSVVTATNGSGQISFDAYDTTAESVTFIATDTTDNVVVTPTVTVVFDAGLPQVDQSTVAANPAAVAADGTTASTITVTLGDHNQNPVPNTTVSLQALNGSSLFSPATAITNTHGIATFQVTDKTAEVVVYRATDQTDNLPLVGEEVTITFGTPQPVAPVVADSDLVASANTVPADGSSSATITAFLNDSNGNPLTGKQVSLVASAGSSMVRPSVGTTDSDGTAAFSVTDKAPETVTYTVMDVTDDVPYSALSVTITFSPSSGGSTTTESTSSSATTQPPSDVTSAHLNQPVVGMTPSSDGRGYWEVAAYGGVANYGDTEFRGSENAQNLSSPIAGIAGLANGNGYWLAAADGGVFPFGDAPSYGSASGITLNAPIVAIAATPNGKGYWLVASDGGIFNYGDANFYGSAGGLHLNSPIVGLASTPDGKGYWLVASDGGIFSYGDANFYGSAGGLHLNSPIVGIASTGSGGYWLVASDGGVFSYGDATFRGSGGGSNQDGTIVGIASNGLGNGYWLVSASGDIYSFGNIASYGPVAG